MKRKYKLGWPTNTSISTKRTITQKTPHISVSAITFSGYTQSQNIVIKK